MELKPNTAYHITALGEIREIAPKNGSDFKLAEAQALVDGHIEVLYLNSDWIMILNEDGKRFKECNDKATRIAHSWQAIRSDDYICGDVIICLSGQLR